VGLGLLLVEMYLFSALPTPAPPKEGKKIPDPELYLFLKFHRVSELFHITLYIPV